MSFWWLLACLAAQSATPTAAPSFQQEIVVTAERGPESLADTTVPVSVLTREQIQLLPAQNLGAILESLGGFRVLFSHDFDPRPVSSSKGFFGGGEVEYVKLLVDGVPVGDVESGLVDWREIRASAIDRIELVRGPASSLYGDASIGGVVQVFTHGEEGKRSSISVSAGSFETRTAEASYATSRAGIGITGLSTDGFRDHSASHSAGADLRVRFPDTWILRVFANQLTREEPGPLSGDELHQDRYGSSSMFRLDGEESERLRVSIDYVAQTPTGLRAVGYGSLRDSEAVRTLLLAPGFGDRAERELTTGAIGVSVEGGRSLLGGATDLRAGVDLSREALDTAYFGVGESGVRTSELSAVEAERQRSGVFLTGDWRPAPRLRISGGVRWDRIDDQSSGSDAGTPKAFSPRIGMNLRLRDGANPVVLFAQFSHAFKAPTLDQRFDPRPFPDGLGGRFTISNPDLKPQRARHFEIGLTQSAASFHWDAAAYRMAVTDEIDFDTSRFRYHNISESRHYGVDLQMRLTRDRSLTPALSYTWTRVEPHTGPFRGNQLKNLPEHDARAGLTWNGETGFAIGASWSWHGRWFLDDANQFPVPGGSSIDLRFLVPVRNAQVKVDLLNLLDENTTEIGFVLPDFQGGLVPFYFPSAGFAAQIGFEYTWR
jgi:iron complex outermembrane receptor protein